MCKFFVQHFDFGNLFVDCDVLLVDFIFKFRKTVLLLNDECDGFFKCFWFSVFQAYDFIICVKKLKPYKRILNI